MRGEDDGREGEGVGDGRKSFVDAIVACSMTRGCLDWQRSRQAKKERASDDDLEDRRGLS